MVIRYTVNKEDMKPFLLRERINSKEYAEEVKSAKRTYVVMSVALLMFGVFNAYRYFVVYKQAEEYIRFLSNAISMAFSAILLFMMQFLASWTKRLFANWEVKGKLKKMDDSHVEEVELNVSDNNISWRMGKKSGSQKMTEKHEVIDEKENYYIYLKKDVVIVPKRIFGAEYDEKQFRKALRIDK